MKTLSELCKIRPSVLLGHDNDDVLDLSNLRDNTIDGDKFFEETYMTNGLEQMIDTAFSRFQGKSDRSLIRLTQNMGGGKSHCMIALGLLAKDPVLRFKLFGDKYRNINTDINVVAYTGRESDIKYGIWGEIAHQLGKDDKFSEYSKNLTAPGQTAWISLLQDSKPTLILLDELPPYLEDAMTKNVGTGTLATVTVTALSNLFTAVSKRELNNVLIVISDLRSNYEGGKALLDSVYNNLDDEIKRYAMDIEPVKRTNDDLFNILKRKCFTEYPEEDSSDVVEIAEEFKNEVAKAKQQGITTASPDSCYSGIINSYPFHYCVKELFGRFKENPNFQQTRGFIRLVRNMVRCLWNSGEADRKYIINAYDIDLRDQQTYSDIRDIKPQLDNAISHDIVSVSGALSMAEECDEGTNKHETEELCKMILVSSLANGINSVLGLNESDLAAFMVGPSYNVGSLRGILENFSKKAWFLYKDKNNRVFFKETKNVNAELATRKNVYTQENAKQYVQKLLMERFRPKTKDVYQEVLVFPGLDQINLTKDKVTLILFEPNTSGNGLQQQLLEWYNAQKYKNRVCFISGQRNGMQNLLEAAKEALAINSILDAFRNEEHLPESDVQVKTAVDIQSRIILNLCSALKEIFVTIYYPTSTGIRDYQISMQFGENSFDYEGQIRNLLMNTVKKFITIDSADPISDDSFRRKLETRIFSTDKMAWTDIEERAAIEKSWSWYIPSALKEAKNRYIQRGYWIESNGIVNKNPPKPKTGVLIHEVPNTRKNGEVTLQIQPLHGDTIYYEIGQTATLSSLKINPMDLGSFVTGELMLSFLCVDSTGNCETGDATTWNNITSCRYSIYDMMDNKMCTLKAETTGVEIHYTLDGSDPRSDSAAIYKSDITLPKKNITLQAVTYSSKYNLWGNILFQRINNTETAFGNGNNSVATEFRIDKSKPLELRNIDINTSSTSETYDLISSLEKNMATISNINVTINVDKEWYDFSCGEKFIEVNVVRKFIDMISAMYSNGQVIVATITISSVKYISGEKFEDWIALEKKQIADFANKIVQ